MAHQVLQCLWIHAGAGHVAAVGMAADVGRDIGNLDSVNLIVAFDHMVEAMFPVHCHLGQHQQACPPRVQRQYRTE